MFEPFYPITKSRREYIFKLRQKYKFLNAGKIGKSVCSRNIDFLSLGNPKNSVLWVGAHHGMEWITTLVILKFMHDLCQSVQSGQNICGINLKKCLERRGLTVVPCLNPDGVEISLTGYSSAGERSEFVSKISGGDTRHWQANANGVDLNHNYNAGWEELHIFEEKNSIFGPAMTRYGGKTPESEPEVKALTHFCRNNFFEYAIAFHSQGEEIYWDYGNKYVPNAEKLAKTFAIACGYTLDAPQGLAVGGGFKDWFITEFSRPSFTFEIGMGKNPLPIENFWSIYNKLQKALFISVLA